MAKKTKKATEVVKKINTDTLKLARAKELLRNLCVSAEQMDMSGLEQTAGAAREFLDTDLD